MKYFSNILILLCFLAQVVKGQENNVGKELQIFQNEAEKELLTKHQDNPFLLLQSLNPGEQLESKAWKKLLRKLDKRQVKSQNDSLRFLEDIFFLTHRLLLEQYETHAYFSKTLDKGIYDCVSGSGAFALLLDRYSFNYKIIETEAHVYILGGLGNSPFIIESTFPETGLIIGQSSVSEFEKQFKKTEPAMSSTPKYMGQIDRDMNRGLGTSIGLRELAGLQYYNDAIKRFFEEDYMGTFSQLLKAEFLYPSPRIEGFKQKIEALLTLE
ncbi:hypothetical protein A33Q_4148 [Indibacter alkaliphilus LW1]|uniref:Uncharacterized protein n=1 Tax=Indibacter alkaliphilus (strain CCUG 57479 / KCTC 22604 / LW1) TaxID=1189612 RepID=S2D4T8_INDAL|nr:hypothetical protein [Indibacter alkaliphilus]EOZ92055.1 hypothetical protein A33Q_4148 [Indibacter alkaliphilus LW1]